MCQNFSSTVENLEGILCVHVDDTICGGSGSLFSESLTALSSFPVSEVASWGRHVLLFQLCAEQRHQRDHDFPNRVCSKSTKVPMSPARKKMREDPADKAEIHAFRGVRGSISWLAGQARPDVSCQVSQLQQTPPQPTVAQVCASSMVVRRVHQHADLGLEIRRMPIQSMMLLLHVDASLNTGGLVGSQGGYICAVTEKSLLKGRDAPRSPMAWRSFKMTENDS